VNGILHGTFTFLDRAELLLRVAGTATTRSAARRRVLRREAGAELERCGRSLRELARARREGILTPPGVRLLRALRRRHAALGRGCLSGPGHFSIF